MNDEEHLKKIFTISELDEVSTIRKFRIADDDGKNKNEALTEKKSDKAGSLRGVARNEAKQSNPNMKKAQ